MNLANEDTLGNQSADLVSVIIPAYNAAPYIKDTLESVFGQTYKSFQIVVVNDGSPDTPALEELLLPYRDRIIYIKQENRGLSGARNTGLRAATGSMVALLDADDIWTPDYLEEQTKYLREHPEYDLVYCNCRFFGQSIYDGKEYMDVCPSNGEATSAAIISRRCHVFVSVTARTEVLKRFGFDESLRSCEDFDCWLRFTAAGHRIGYHRKVLVLYRKHAASLSADLTWMADYNIRVLTNALTLWPEGSEEATLLLQAKATKTADLENIRGKIALRNQDIPTAITHLQAANSFYKSTKISAVIFLLRVAPSSVVALFKLRGALLPSYHEGAK
ncbi:MULTISPECIES: glycosyltransferase family A protein [Acidobacteriaceae]|uniref:glycosyltransferase family 2 protein n=1 Tax=Acidobacteriaceae TaxID=204434 RepID=UPI00131B2D6F|nr:MULTISPECIES: glycosyltransferase family A protein [Acidobacteriaceae]MDW5267494.1 glycosyltransferase family A protein [Edaphobacter sp.]